MNFIKRMSKARSNRMIGIGFALLGLTACSHYINSAGSIAPIKEKIIPLHEVTDIRVEGPLNVKLNSGPRAEMILLAPPPILSKIKIRHRPHQLKLSYQLSRKQLVVPTLIITTPQLQTFIYRGKGHLEANLYASALNVAIDNPMPSVLKGHLGLHHVVVSGGGTARFLGVNSSALDLTVRQASTVIMQGHMRLAHLSIKDNCRLFLNRMVANRMRIRAHGRTLFQLSGQVNQLDMTLWDRAKFKGRDLRVNNSFIKTFDNAFAEISTTGHQHTLANNESKIICHRLPITEADFMVNDGTVLNFHPNPNEVDTTFDP